MIKAADRNHGNINGLKDLCNVPYCTEHFRCFDVEKPQRCPIWKLHQKELEQKNRAAEKRAQKAEERRRQKEQQKQRAKRKRTGYAYRHKESGRTFYKVDEAAAAFGVSHATIHNQCNKPDGRFERVRIVEGMTIEGTPPANRGGNRRGRKVLHIPTGVVYSSFTHAAEATYMSRYTIARDCHGQQQEYRFAE